MAEGSSFVAFESGQVRPLALSPDGARLFAVNTPDGRLEWFDVTDAGLVRDGTVAVGLEPVAVAARSSTEVWVVNHLSDSITVVDVGAEPPRIARTLLVGDEPRDIVFAGPEGQRAFVTTARRGQHRPSDPQLQTRGIGRADVWVFDATSVSPDPLAIVTVFSDTPRALATSPDGAVVYVAAFQSGNRTSAVGEGAVCDGGPMATCAPDGLPMPGGMPAPIANADGVPGPEVGLIVRYDETTGKWLDVVGRDWRNAMRFTLPDRDVFAIDAMASPPVQTAAYPHVGTVIYNLAVNPITGALYASNTEARNDVRFAGEGVLAGSSVRGRLHESRITVVGESGAQPVHLNSHIDYDVVPSPAGVAEKSLATPTGMAVSPDGETVYVAALGSNAIGVLAASALESGDADPDARAQFAVPGGGPTGVVLDATHERLYVLARFANAIDVLDAGTGAALQQVKLHNPEPSSIVEGRRFLYDARLGSSNGEQACATCHVFGDVDGLGWDLGDPDGVVVANPNPMRSLEPMPAPDFHPMKGPLTTQTLRGMATHGAMHWRGDRTGGLLPGIDPRDEHAAFLQFNGAFPDLLGRTDPLADADMEAFADFVLQIVSPPNPVRALDGTLDSVEQEGRTAFDEQDCRECHVTNPSEGFFGTDGFVATTGTNQKQVMKIPHLENFYTKVGLFLMPFPFNFGDTTSIGPQVRGFGYTHNGSVGFYNGSPEIERYLLAFETQLEPIVGQQVTEDATNAVDAGPRIDLLLARAAAGACDLVVRGVLDGEDRAWARGPGGTFRSDRAAEEPAAAVALRAHVVETGETRTWTCWPPGSGERAGRDRDGDGLLDRDELDVGTDPADAGSVPFACAEGVAIARTRVRLTRRHDGWAMVVRGQVIAASPFDPTVDDLHLALSGPAGVPIVDAVVPAGDARWRVRRAGTQWRFLDVTPGARGIVGAVVTDRSAEQPGLADFRIVVRGVPRLPAAPLPITVALDMGAAAPPCALVTFTSAECRRRASGLGCRVVPARIGGP